MESNKIKVSIEHGGLNESISMKEIIEPISDFFDETFIRENFSFLKNDENQYSLIISSKSLEFEFKEFENARLAQKILENIHGLDIGTVDATFSFEIDEFEQQTFNYLFYERLTNVNMEFLGFKLFDSTNNSSYLISMFNRDAFLNVWISSEFEIKETEEINQNLEFIYMGIKDYAIPELNTFLGR